MGWLAAQRARFAPEFESCRRIALEHRVPLRNVYEAAQKAFRIGEVKRNSSGIPEA